MTRAEARRLAVALASTALLVGSAAGSFAITFDPATNRCGGIDPFAEVPV